MSRRPVAKFQTYRESKESRMATKIMSQVGEKGQVGEKDQ